MFLPREHDVYHQIMPYMIVFDTAGDFNHITCMGDLIISHAFAKTARGKHAYKVADKMKTKE
jgi:hypothetical protein